MPDPHLLSPQEVLLLPTTLEVSGLRSHAGGAKRLQIEAVRMAASVRGSGLGSALLAWAHDYGRAHGASMAQLTAGKQRADAHRFYQRLGCRPSHEGFKLPL